MSSSLLVSWRTRLPAGDPNATNRPSADSEGVLLLFLACAPVAARLARTVVPAARSRTNTSVRPLVSPGTRLAACDRKATRRPSAEIEGEKLGPEARPPLDGTLIRLVLPARTSRANTLVTRPVSPPTR